MKQCPECPSTGLVHRKGCTVISSGRCPCCYSPKDPVTGYSTHSPDCSILTGDPADGTVSDAAPIERTAASGPTPRPKRRRRASRLRPVSFETKIGVLSLRQVDWLTDDGRCWALMSKLHDQSIAKVLVKFESEEQAALCRAWLVAIATGDVAAKVGAG